VPGVSLLSFDFCIPYSCTGIQRNYIWDPSAQGWSRKLLLQLVFSKKGYADDQGIFTQAKFSFGPYCFQIEVWSCLRIPASA